MPHPSLSSIASGFRFSFRPSPSASNCSVSSSAPNHKLYTPGSRTVAKIIATRTDDIEPDEFRSPSIPRSKSSLSSRMSFKSNSTRKRDSSTNPNAESKPSRSQRSSKTHFIRYGEPWILQNGYSLHMPREGVVSATVTCDETSATTFLMIEAERYWKHGWELDLDWVSEAQARAEETEELEGTREGIASVDHSYIQGGSAGCDSLVDVSDPGADADVDREESQYGGDDDTQVPL